MSSKVIDILTRMSESLAIQQQCAAELIEVLSNADVEVVNEPAKPKDPNKRTKGTLLPPQDFTVTEPMLDWFTADFPGSNLNLALETDKFRDNTFKRKYRDWTRVWKNWVRNAIKYGEKDGTVTPTKKVDKSEELKNKYRVDIAELQAQAKVTKGMIAQAVSNDDLVSAAQYQSEYKQVCARGRLLQGKLEKLNAKS